MKNEIIPIQYLRGLAALLVIAVHAPGQLDWLSKMFSFPWGTAGVDLFFVISGFIMIYTTHNKNITPQDFIKNRIKRIVPIYWFYTSVYILIALALPNLVRTFEFDWDHILASYFFIAYPSPVLDAFNPVLIVGWTLNYEMLFYVIFALSLFTKKSYQLIFMIFFLAFPIIFYINANPNTWYLSTLIPNNWINFYTNPIFLEFLYGVILGYLYINKLTPKGNWKGVLIIVLGLAYFLIVEFQLNRAFSAGVASFIILLGALAINIQDTNSAKHRLLHMIGDASYSIYLSHIFTLGLLRFILNKLELDPSVLNAVLIMISALVMSSIIGILSFILIEKPILIFLKKIKNKRMAIYKSK